MAIRLMCVLKCTVVYIHIKIDAYVLFAFIPFMNINSISRVCAFVWEVSLETSPGSITVSNKVYVGN